MKSRSIAVCRPSLVSLTLLLGAAVIPGCVPTFVPAAVSINNATEHHVVLNIDGFPSARTSDYQLEPGLGLATGGGLCELDGTNTIRVRATVLAPGNETTVEAEIEYPCFGSTTYSITEVAPGEFAIVLKVDRE